MEYGWLIAGPGTTWVIIRAPINLYTVQLELTRNFREATPVFEPQKALKRCEAEWPGIKFKLWTLKAEAVEE